MPERDPAITNQNQVMSPEQIYDFSNPLFSEISDGVVASLVDTKIRHLGLVLETLNPEYDPFATTGKVEIEDFATHFAGHARAENTRDLIRSHGKTDDDIRIETTQILEQLAVWQEAEAAKQRARTAEIISKLSTEKPTPTPMSPKKIGILGRFGVRGY